MDHPSLVFLSILDQKKHLTWAASFAAASSAADASVKTLASPVCSRVSRKKASLNLSSFGDFSFLESYITAQATCEKKRNEKESEQQRQSQAHKITERDKD